MGIVHEKVNRKSGGDQRKCGLAKENRMDVGWG